MSWQSWRAWWAGLPPELKLATVASGLAVASYLYAMWRSVAWRRWQAGAEAARGEVVRFDIPPALLPRVPDPHLYPAGDWCRRWGEELARCLAVVDQVRAAIDPPRPAPASAPKPPPAPPDSA